jgi:protein-S-isoprenylcysteine O-methyltransferase Ste14
MHALAPTARVLYNATLIAWVIAEVRQSRHRRGEATERDAGSIGVIRVTVVLGIVVSSIASGVTRARMPWPRADLFAVGIVVMWAGIGLRLWAFRTLGRYFTFRVMTSHDQAVVTNGPYRVLRHPSYAGALLACLGIGIVQANWISLAAIVVIPLIGMVNRIRVEERALLDTLGDRYREYATGRKRLVPFVW